MKKKLVCILMIMFFQIQSLILNAQERKTISGKVTTFGVIPLNNVRFTASKSGEVVYSDSLGLFSINCSEKDVIKIFAFGFDGTKVKAKKDAHPSIDLIYSNSNTSFKTAVKNEHISKEQLEKAILKYPLKGQKDYSRYNTIYELISSEIRTVKVSGSSVTTRKQNSFSHSQEVLYVVDEVIVQDISFVLTFNVKAIRYVDGAGAAKYGSRGANGAIEISLKR